MEIEILGIKLEITYANLEELRTNGQTSVEYYPPNVGRLEDTDVIHLSRRPQMAIGAQSHNHGVQLYSPYDTVSQVLNHAIEMAFLKGILYVRLLNNQVRDLFYVRESVYADYIYMLCRRLADFTNEGTQSGPAFGMYTDTAHYGEVSGSGNTITFEFATQSYLQQYFSKWGPSVTVENWMSNVAKEKELLDSEKQRLALIFKS